jgi:hypothetical protein
MTVLPLSLRLGVGSSRGGGALAADGKPHSGETRAPPSRARANAPMPHPSPVTRHSYPITRHPRHPSPAPGASAWPRAPALARLARKPRDCLRGDGVGRTHARTHARAAHTPAPHSLTAHTHAHTHARTHTHTCARAHKHMHIHTHAHARTHLACPPHAFPPSFLKRLANLRGSTAAPSSPRARASPRLAGSGRRRRRSTC